MSIQYKDYYDILGVSRDASKDDIQRAYRKLARKFHPDLNKEAGAEETFKEINEAYEVLKDPAKREKYDQIGNGWQQGDHFQSPPGWQYRSGYGGGSQGAQQSFFFSSDGGKYSDFFEALFGGGFQDGFYNASDDGSFNLKRRGSDHEAVLTISLEEALRGGKKNITMQSAPDAVSNSPSFGEKRYEVRIPPGILSGQKIRLSGQGGQGTGGGASGDLLLRIDIKPHPKFELKGRDLYTELAITPWEAALGAQIDVETLAGPVTLKVPPGSQSGQKLRLRAKGMPNPKGPQGDLYVVMQIKVPKRPSGREKELFEELKKVSAFSPR